jgi:DNA-binding transcriptional ArsR family regulator
MQMSNTNHSSLPAVSFRFIPLVELITALYRTANLELFLGKNKEWQVKTDENAGKTLTGMEQRLSPFLRRELRFFFGIRHPSVNQAFHELVFLNPTLQTIEDLLLYITELPPSLMIRCMCEDVAENAIRSELLDCITRGGADAPQEMSGALSRFLGSAEGSSIAECLTYPMEARERFLTLLRGFYDIAFAPVEAELTHFGKQSIPKFERIYAEDSITFYTRFVQTNSDTFTKDILVHVSVINPLGISSTLTDARDVPDYVRLGMLTDERLQDKGNDAEAEQFSKAIADKRRLEILQLLSQRRWYGQELAGHLDLTSAAVSYHMSFLFQLDLVSFQRLDHRVYYDLNKERLRDLLDRLRNLLLPNSVKE